jgi:hypothetical protein
MATTGYRLAGANANIGTTNFANLANSLAENDSVSSFTTTTKNATGTIEFSNFGFGALIPAGATIDQVNLKFRGSVTTGASAHGVLLRVSTTDGSEISLGTFSGSLVTVESTSYARPGGGSWTRDDLLNGTLVARARSLQPNNTTSRIYSWAWVEVEVVYTAGTAHTKTVTSDGGLTDDATYDHTPGGTPPIEVIVVKRITGTLVDS